MASPLTLREAAKRAVKFFAQLGMFSTEQGTPLADLSAAIDRDEANAVLLREPCSALRCRLGWEGCKADWLTGRTPRDELWACCTRCGKRRLFLSRLITEESR